jgi:hypothetical protein
MPSTKRQRPRALSSCNGHCVCVRSRARTSSGWALNWASTRWSCSGFVGEREIHRTLLDHCPRISVPLHHPEILNHLVDNYIHQIHMFMIVYLPSALYCRSCKAAAQSCATERVIERVVGIASLAAVKHSQKCAFIAYRPSTVSAYSLTFDAQMRTGTARKRSMTTR